MPPAVERFRFRVGEFEDCGVDVSRKGFCDPVSRPGVELNTEYSSANVGVQPLRFSKFELFLGV
jgi:hypothetical protein